MIHKHIQVINQELMDILPKKCGEDIWKYHFSGLGKMVWHENDSIRRIHDQKDEFIVRDDDFDLQTCHLIDRIRKTKADQLVNVPIYTVECSWVGVGTKLASGLMAMSVFEQLEWLGIYASDLDNNTERILSSYWGIDRDKFGQNPEYHAWRISYNYTLPVLDRDDLLILEGLNDLD